MRSALIAPAEFPLGVPWFSLAGDYG